MRRQVGLDALCVSFVKLGGIALNLRGANIVHTRVQSHVLLLGKEDVVLVTRSEVLFQLRDAFVLDFLPTLVELRVVVKIGLGEVQL